MWKRLRLHPLPRRQGAPRLEPNLSVAARRQVKAPAIALLLTGILNWVLIPAAMLLFQWGVPHAGIYSRLAVPEPVLVVLGLLSLALCSFIVFAALKMMQLEDRTAAMVASVLAILVSPGNLVGLPVGIWSLVVLNQREVREAFVPRRRRTPDTTPVSSWVLVARWTARVSGTLLLGFYAIFILAEGLPPIAAQPEGVQLNFVALGLMLAGFAVGWKREGTAALLVASGWTLWHISEGRISWNFLQTPVPVAALYGFCWWATRGRRTGVVVWTTAALAVALGLGRLLLPTSVFVRGQVVDALTGQPVQHVELRLLPRPQRADKGDFPNARSDEQGRYRLYVGWYGAGKRVIVSRAGYTTLTTNLGPRALGQRNVSRDFCSGANHRSEKHRQTCGPSHPTGGY